MLAYSHRLVTAVRATQKMSTAVDDKPLSRQFVKGLQDRTLARILVRELDARPVFTKIRQQALQWCEEEETQTATAAALPLPQSPFPNLLLL